ARVHADEAEWIRAVRVLGAELPAREAPVVDAELVGAGAAEARTLTLPRAAAVAGAVRPADTPPAAVAVRRAGGADAIAGRRAVGAEGVSRGAVERGLAGDAGAARRGRRVARRGIGREGRYADAVGAGDLERRK